MADYDKQAKQISPGREVAPATPMTALQFRAAVAEMSVEEQRQALQPSVYAHHLPLQYSSGSTGTQGDVHSTAQGGVSGGGGALPHLNTIQQAFGKHDVSSVQAYVGGAAESATTALGAEAYATGNKVAFKQSPSLHTAAHEAAHTVQQKAGVSLPGGVGSVGDKYEQHADSVADAVVQGRSAESLLETGTGLGRSAVQKKAVQMTPGTAPASSGSTTTTSAGPGRPVAGVWETKVTTQGIAGWGQFKSKLNLRQYQGLKTPAFIEIVAEYVWYGYNCSDQNVKRQKADALNAYMRSQGDMLHTDENGAFFWSGVGQDNAADMARNEGGRTLEMTIAGSLFNGLAFGTAGYADWIAKLGPLWDSLSNHVAQGMSGKVTAYQYVGLRTGSVFDREEFPVIKDLIDDGIVSELEARLFYQHPDETGGSKRFHHTISGPAAIEATRWADYRNPPNGGYPPGVAPGTRW